MGVPSGSDPQVTVRAVGGALHLLEDMNTRLNHLEQRVKQQDDRIKALEDENAQLKQRVQVLEDENKKLNDDNSSLVKRAAKDEHETAKLKLHVAQLQAFRTESLMRYLIMGAQYEWDRAAGDLLSHVQHPTTDLVVAAAAIRGEALLDPAHEFAKAFMRKFPGVELSHLVQFLVQVRRMVYTVEHHSVMYVQEMYGVLRTHDGLARFAVDYVARGRPDLHEAARAWVQVLRERRSTPENPCVFQPDDVQLLPEDEGEV